MTNVTFSSSRLKLSQCIFVVRWPLRKNSNNNLYSFFFPGPLQVICQLSSNKMQKKKKSLVAPDKNLHEISNCEMNHILYKHGEGIGIFFFLLSLSVINAQLHQHERLRSCWSNISFWGDYAFCNQPWQYQEIIQGCQQAKKEVMNIIEALSDFAFSSKQSFSRQL